MSRPSSAVVRPKVLVVDDGDRYIELFHALLRDYDYATRCELPGPCWECPYRVGCELTHAHDWSETEQALARHDDLDVVLLDVNFDLPESRLLPSEADLDTRRRGQGLQILEKLRQRRRALPVVLMTSAEALGQSAAPWLADEYLTFAGDEAFDVRALGLLIERLLARSREAPTDTGYVWGASPAMSRLRRDAQALARTSLPLLLLGETGTGKSALAERVVHAASGRSEFVAVDLSAIPESLAAAELFGSARGAFSGAVDRPGRFEQADGGTLFLDEVGNLPPAAQRMLLLALQDGRVTRLGEGRPREVDVKLVAATNADLEGRVRDGEFRADLYARLNPAARLVLPPLRDRPEDLRALAESFIARRFGEGPDHRLLGDYMEAAGIEGPPSAAVGVGESETPRAGVVFVFPKESWEQLRGHSWPGNVRELELLVVGAAAMTLADALQAAEARRSAHLARVLPISARVVRDLLARSWVSTEEGRAPTSEVVPRPHLRDVARDLERALFERLFRETEGDFRAMAARLLEGDPEDNARRVRLRFNQLGLRARG